MTRDNITKVPRGLGAFGVWHEKIWTGAQLALSTFTDMFLKEHLYPTPEELIPIVRDSYYGGVTQVYR